MDRVTRRSFLVKGSAGAAGLATVTALGGHPVAAEPRRSEPELSPDEVAAMVGPVVVAIRDAEKGEVEILVGDQEIVYVDRPLVARVLRPAR